MTRGKHRVRKDFGAWVAECLLHGTSRNHQFRQQARDEVVLASFCPECEQDADRKSCAQCHRLLPTEEFGGDRKSLDGLKSWCRGCNNAASRQAHDRRKAEKLEAKRVIQEPPPRVCPSCSLLIPAKAFRNVNAKICNFCLTVSAGYRRCVDCFKVLPDSGFPSKIAKGILKYEPRCRPCDTAENRRQRHRRSPPKAPYRPPFGLVRLCRRCRIVQNLEEFTDLGTRTCNTCNRRIVGRRGRSVKAASPKVKMSYTCPDCDTPVSKPTLCRACYQAAANHRAALAAEHNNLRTQDRVIAKNQTPYQLFPSGKKMLLPERCKAGDKCKAGVDGRGIPIVFPGLCYECDTGKPRALRREVIGA